ncbi:MAG: helix-turn-helix domain-containing protein [Bacteroidia bacterium]|nr:helix-turn-helix domain-containing protein [Bacteroidia bacterium]
MKISVIRSETEYEKALALADRMFDKRVKKGTPDGDDLELLLLVIKDYEDKYYPLAPPDPIEAIKLTMNEKGLKNKDLEKFIGSKGYVSQILNRKKPLTINIMRSLHKYLGIPAEILLA